MEDLLYLSEIQKKLHIGLVSVLPEFYVKKLNMILFEGVKETLEYVLKHQGARQKVSIVPDGARILLTPN
jgi:nickel-dependent lactate racemase